MFGELVQKMKGCSRVAVLTGAGISAESGVPTFRGKEGLWGKFRPQELATMKAFMDNPKLVWEWYNWRRSIINEVKPNPGHCALAELEGLVERFTLITQNVDGLHRRAGSQEVLEIHGNILRNKCMKCGRGHADADEIDPDNIPKCTSCGGRIRPDVVWFGEMLSEETIQLAFQRTEEAQVFLSVGTSAVVHPAASLPLTARHSGAILVEVNLEPTPITELADYSFIGQSGEVLPKLVGAFKAEVAGADRAGN